VYRSRGEGEGRDGGESRGVGEGVEESLVWFGLGIKFNHTHTRIGPCDECLRWHCVGTVHGMKLDGKY